MNTALDFGKWNSQSACPALKTLVGMVCCVVVVSLMFWGSPVAGQEPGASNLNPSVAQTSAVGEPATIDPLEPLENPIESVVELDLSETSKASLLRTRLICFAFFGGLLLVFLAILFGYLRLDHATRGFHSGRIQLAALVLSAIVLVVGYLIWTNVLFK